ncbi:MAG: hypothetical protein ACOX6T_11315 [Myxococcales bacterium]
MRASKWSPRLSLLSAALLALGAACSIDRPIAPDPEETVPSGTATVFGTALRTSFDFGAQLATGIFDEQATAIALDLNLCEVGCALFGIEVESGSRAVLINLSAPRSELVAGAKFNARTQLTALAVLATGAADLYAPAFQTHIEEAQSGSLIIDAISLEPGGSISGRFDFTMDFGGAINGSFEIPLLRLDETGAGR